MKRKVLIITICIAVMTAAGFIFFRPMPLVASPSDVVVTRVHYNWRDITDGVDKEMLLEILSRYNTRRSFENPFPSFVADTVWDIGIVGYGGFVGYRGSVNIDLGTHAIRYRSASDRIVRRVINPQALMDELSAMILGD